ncbi:MAG: 50S ribosomal protein L20 [Proteobacteria bacterium]|nr:50S ribosomal protein L20 [Pseudomonadota bacterium]
MPRVKRGFKLRRRRKRVLALAKGFTGPRSKLFRMANETIARALKYAYRDRRTRKREFRSLWITRINAAVRNNGINYSQFIHGLQMADIKIDRKVLSDMAIFDPQSFAQLVSIARENIQRKAPAAA